MISPAKIALKKKAIRRFVNCEWFVVASLVPFTEGFFMAVKEHYI